MFSVDMGVTDRTFTTSVSGTENQKNISLKEMLNHNEAVGWKEWFKYGQTVYSVSSLKNILLVQLQQRLAETCDDDKHSLEEKSHAISEDDDDVTDDDDSEDDDDSDNDMGDFRCEAVIDNILLWRGHPVSSLISGGMDREQLKASLSQCCVGNLPGPGSDQYWDDVRSEIQGIEADLERDISECRHELLEVCHRWLRLYRYTNPPAKAYFSFRGDLNRDPFPLPEDVQRDPNVLRTWVETWDLFDTIVPENGAWKMKEVEHVDLVDPDEIFRDALRPSARCGDQFITDVDGETAWEVLPENAIELDLTTGRQDQILQRRENRKHLYSEKHMKARRKQIADYFIQKYSFDQNELDKHLLFADRMRTNAEEFQVLCQEMCTSSTP